MSTAQSPARRFLGIIFSTPELLKIKCAYPFALLQMGRRWFFNLFPLPALESWQHFGKLWEALKYYSFDCRGSFSTP